MKKSIFASCFLVLALLNPINSEIANAYSHVNYVLPTHDMKVALTFDDGPYAINTPYVLDILKEENVKATFFLLGENFKGNEDLIRHIVVEGHEIGLHTYTHPNFYKLNYEEIKKEIVDNIRGIESIIGYAPNFIRPPYGIITDDFLCICEKLDLTVICWSVDTLDWKVGQNSSDMVKTVCQELRPGSIILMHDKSANYKCSRAALRRIIRTIKNEGYNFATLSEFFS